MTMKLTRRNFLKTNAISATATVAGITIPRIKEVLAAHEGYDPFVKAGEGVKFYANLDGRANSLPSLTKRQLKCRMKNMTCG